MLCKGNEKYCITHTHTRVYLLCTIVSRRRICMCPSTCRHTYERRDQHFWSGTAGRMFQLTKQWCACSAAHEEERPPSFRWRGPRFALCHLAQGAGTGHVLRRDRSCQSPRPRRAPLALAVFDAPRIGRLTIDGN